MGNIASSLDILHSTISALLMCMEVLKKMAPTAAPASTTHLTRLCDDKMESIKAAWKSWVDECNRHDMPLSRVLFSEKAVSQCLEVHTQDDDGSCGGVFVSSRGWFHHFLDGLDYITYI